jgi:hypothetical protein
LVDADGLLRFRKKTKSDIQDVDVCFTIKVCGNFVHVWDKVFGESDISWEFQEAVLKEVKDALSDWPKMYIRYVFARGEKLQKSCK